MIDFDSLLYPVFDELRRHGIPLGVSEYMAALQAVMAGKGLEDPEKLKRLCGLVWAKSKDDLDFLNVVFEEKAAPLLKAPGDSLKSEKSDKQAPQYCLEQELEKRSFESRQAVKEKSIKPVKHVPQKAKQDFFHLNPILPVSTRDMAQVFRRIRNMQPFGRAEELDVPGTVNSICKTKFFLGPVLKPRRQNRAKLLLFIDCQGSMEPFEWIVNALKKSISKSGMLENIRIYYFHDCPGRYIYEKPGLTAPVPVEHVLNDDYKNYSALIISDAGAARGYFDEERIEDTGKFLEKLKLYIHRYAWLNPVPVKRWTAATAEDIAQMIPMFALDQDSLNDMINVLKGQS
ncbi:Uncharacterized protein dnl_52450 [Desulfonema limicola]|uniref:VWA containing CoxE family protein n=1 Tax=Desulfonema limicola TaxID=45656 RepID=A0A975GIR2_9BACT|nr:hypothetical protein [Desulfonema limicola]QTA82860.1 Uncharacterized protein dnl_52450 [Desulfonema limicola]